MTLRITPQLPLDAEQVLLSTIEPARALIVSAVLHDVDYRVERLCDDPDLQPEDTSYAWAKGVLLGSDFKERVRERIQDTLKTLEQIAMQEIDKMVVTNDITDLHFRSGKLDDISVDINVDFN